MDFNQIKDDLKIAKNVFQKLINPLNKWGPIIEIILVLVITITARNVDFSDFNKWNTTQDVLAGFLLICISLYVLLKIYVKLINDSYPNRFFDNLEAQVEMKAKESSNQTEVKELKSKINSIDEKMSQYKIVNDSFSDSILLLSNITCDYNFETDTTIAVLRNLFGSLISQNGKIFNTEGEITLGVYLTNVLAPNYYPVDLESKLISEDKVYIFWDDYKLSNSCLPENLMDSTEFESCVLDIQTSIRKSFNFGESVKESIEVDSGEYWIIRCGIPESCTTNNFTGVLFAFIKSDQSISENSESILKVFGRILSLWRSEYNGCVNGGFSSKINQLKDMN